MKYLKKSLLVSFAFLFMFLTILPTASAKTWPSKSVGDVMKPWKVKFNHAVLPESVTNDTVFVMEGGKKVPTQLKLIDGGFTVEVKPVVPYQLGKDYSLEVTDSVKSLNGKKLKGPSILQFNILDKSAAIQSVTHMGDTGFTKFTVMVRSDVHRVRINTTDLTMTGKDVYSHTLLDTKQGSTVTIRAYGEKGNVLETKTYTIH